MSAWQQLMIIADVAEGGGFTWGRVRYPLQYKDQNANDVLAALGQHGFEVSHVEPTSGHQVVLILKKQA